MADMSIAHFGTTLIEAPAPEGADQAGIPKTGDLEKTARDSRSEEEGQDQVNNRTY